MPKQILSIDYGTKNIGIAITDNNNQFALPLVVLENNNLFIKKLQEIINDENIGTIVLGFPKTYNNLVSQRHEIINDFYKTLKETFHYLEIVLFDESYTTQMSLNIQKESGLKNKHIKKSKDMVSAAFILESYLKYVNNKNNY